MVCFGGQENSQHLLGKQSTTSCFMGCPHALTNTNLYLPENVNVKSKVHCSTSICCCHATRCCCGGQFSGLSILTLEKAKTNFLFNKWQLNGEICANAFTLWSSICHQDEPKIPSTHMSLCSVGPAGMAFAQSPSSTIFLCPNSQSNAKEEEKTIVVQ